MEVRLGKLRDSLSLDHLKDDVLYGFVIQHINVAFDNWKNVSSEKIIEFSKTDIDLTHSCTKNIAPQ